MIPLQTIKNIQGRAEYVLLPVFVYLKLKQLIDSTASEESKDYEDFDPSNFIKNPIALRRMKAKLTQGELAKQLKVSQAYVSKIEQDNYELTEIALKKAYDAIRELEAKNMST
ncbi:MAG: helix-turn-helix transcriptional regulator [Gammaproteobacteria bacterium]